MKRFTHAQSSAVRGAIVFCYSGVGAIIFAALAIALLFLNVERELPAVQRDLERRAREGAAAPPSPSVGALGSAYTKGME